MKDVRGRDFGFLPIPRRLRYQAEAPPHFGFVLLGVFALASTFSRSMAMLANHDSS